MPVQYDVPMRERMAGYTLRYSGRACLAISLSLLLAAAVRAQQQPPAAPHSPAASKSITQDLSFGGGFVVSVTPNLPIHSLCVLLRLRFLQCENFVSRDQALARPS